MAVDVRQSEDPAPHVSRRLGLPSLLAQALSLLALAFPVAAAEVPCVRVLSETESQQDRPEEQLCDTWVDTPRFRIHFATSGPHQVFGWPSLAYVDSLALYLERIHRRCGEELGFPPVRTDEFRGGGLDRIDCYLTDIPERAQGIAVSEGRGLASCSRSRSGYFVLRNTFDTPEFGPLLDQVAGHEYFHLIQFGAGANDTWFMESSATWAESRILPRSLRYAWNMRTWFLVPHLTLWDPGQPSLAYGAPHFWICASALTDSTLMPSLLGRLCREDWLPAMKEELVLRGLGFPELLARFALWNNATAEWSDGDHYADAAEYPAIAVQGEHRSYPVVQAEIPEALRAREGGTNFIRFTGPGTTDTLRLSCEGPSGSASVLRIAVAAQASGAPQREWVLIPDPDGDATLAIPGWSALDRVTLMAVRADGAGGDGPFRYSAEEAGPVSREGLGPIYAYPNPLVHPLMDEIHLVWDSEGFRDRTVLSIFDVQGRLVLQEELGEQGPGRHEWDWKARLRQGERAASGVYFARLRSGGREAGARILVLR